MNLRYLACSALLLSAVAVVMAQQEKSQVKREAAPPTSPVSGKEMFTSYCASCHGKSAKGDGPASKALNSPPADLTTLAKRHGGKYPSDKVAAVLRGQTNLAPHGDQEMPVWGPVFWHMSGGHEALVQQRITNLNHYIESLQEK
jgi:mono/diheme cytochrome c family protein